MKEKLEKLLENAYCPYSNFPVSCIIVMVDGKEFSGVNVENASYGATLCAERNAISSAIASGYKKGDFKEVHILTSSEKIGTCCGICRQFISEFFELTANIFCYNKNGQVKTFTVEELLPYSFDEGDLK